MTSNIYDNKNSRTILEKIHEKGWDICKSKNLRQSVECLEINETYVILPKSENQRDSGQPPSSLETLSDRLNGKTSTIRYNGKGYKWTGFSLFNSQVLINTSEGIWVSYPNFINALEYITDIGTK